MAKVHKYNKQFRNHKIEELIDFRLSCITDITIEDYFIVKDMLKLCNLFNLDKSYKDSIKNRFKEFKYDIHRV